jgi:hypothetical protein
MDGNAETAPDAFHGRRSLTDCGNGWRATAPTSTAAIRTEPDQVIRRFDFRVELPSPKPIDALPACQEKNQQKTQNPVPPKNSIRTGLSRVSTPGGRHGDWCARREERHREGGLRQATVRLDLPKMPEWQLSVSLLRAPRVWRACKAVMRCQVGLFAGDKWLISSAHF